MMEDTRQVVIVPCSGIGKTYGTVSREAAYEVVEDLRPQTSQLVPLSLLVLGEEYSTIIFLPFGTNVPYSGLEIVSM